MAKKIARKAPKRTKRPKTVVAKRRKTTNGEFLGLLISQTEKYLKQSDGRVDKGAQAQLLRLQGELANLIGGNK